jgi:hypothetical protein
MRMLAATDWSLFAKGVLTIVAAVIFLMGSVFVLLQSFVGKKMAYLIEASAFFAWMLMLSLIWTFGFWSQGPTLERFTGPQGAAAAWVPVAASVSGTQSNPYVGVTKDYPGGSWTTATPGQEASRTEVISAVQQYLTNQANAAKGLPTTAPVPPQWGGPQPSPGSTNTAVPVTTDQFTVQNVMFTVAPNGKTPLAAAQAFYSGGGPVITVFLYHDRGSVPIYSWIVLIISVVGLLIHVPLLDRTERKRKAWLTGGGAMPAGS